ncbi:CoA transferase, partial [Sinorhizobium psoraleae]|uniref:CoA transferase n=1 Tax=Sinorhizobium psoraleae TaxID=520838 RepID=UPI0035E3CC73
GWRGSSTPPIFHACNRGKRSVVLDFTTEEGQEAVRRWRRNPTSSSKTSRSAVTPNTGSTMRASERSIRGSSIVQVTGFGQDGPDAHRAGFYDHRSGHEAASWIGPVRPDGEPQKIGVAFADIFTGLYGVIAVQAALVQARTHGARGSRSTWRCSIA